MGGRYNQPKAEIRTINSINSKTLFGRLKTKTTHREQFPSYMGFIWDVFDKTHLSFFSSSALESSRLYLFWWWGR